MDSQRDARAALEEYHLRGWREIGRELGRGSYAAVVEVDYKGLKCAGKKIYRVLYEQGVGNLVSRFEEECRLLSQLRHPHVVQFLGIYFEPDTNLPVLVMEFLPTTLAQCLDTYGVLPEEINYGILHDVALGLRYLHERPQPIVHRDLSANNVLLTSDMRGKISDLGVAKILGPAAQRSRMTCGPGTPAYMPPEATVPNPRYDIKVDIFSYGVMMIHTLSGRWPFPGEAVPVNPNNPAELIPVSEVGRRQEYLDDIAGDHPLMQLIHRCLRNSAAHRPDASYVSQQVGEAASHAPPSFTNKVEMMERIRVDAEQRATLRGENERLTQEMEATASVQEALSGQAEELRQQVTDQGQRIEIDGREKVTLRDNVRVLTQEKEAGNRELMAKTLEIEELRLQVTHLQADATQLNGSLAHNSEAYKQALSQKDRALALKEQAHQQALALKDQTHQQALTAKEQAHQQALSQKDQALALKKQTHQQALTAKDQAHQQALTAKEQAHQQALSQKDQALALKEWAHRQALTVKDQAHQQALALEDQTHQQVLSLKDQAHQQVLTVHQADLQEQQAELQTKLTELSILQRELTSMRDNAARKQETIGQLREQLSRCRTHLASNQQHHRLTPGATLVWRECTELPFTITDAQAVVIDGVVYVGGGIADEKKESVVCRYHPGEDKWATLPPAHVKLFGVGQISGQLVLVGGEIKLTGDITRMVNVFVNETQQWKRSIPPMATARRAPAVVSHATVLVVCGGVDHSRTILQTVELYSSETSQWYQCPPLPFPRHWMSSVAIGDTLFLAGGFSSHTIDTARKSIFSVSLSTLIDRTLHHSSDSPSLEGLWTNLKDFPYFLSTAASIGGCLLVLGGLAKSLSNASPIASVQTYLPNSSTWCPVGELPLPLYRTTAVLLPTGELLVIGGRSRGYKSKTRRVFNGTLEII